MGGEYTPEDKPKREKNILDNITVVGKLNMNENKTSKAINIAIASSRLINTSLKSVDHMSTPI